EGEFDVDVVIQPPADAVLGSLQVFLLYPDGVVGLPGSGPDALASIQNLPGDAFTLGANDLDYGVYVLALGPAGLTLGDTPPTLFFPAQFKNCQGAQPPAGTDFSCSVVNATLVEGMDVTSQTTCSVVVVVP